jgi:hypothetical protein
MVLKSNRISRKEQKAEMILAIQLDDLIRSYARYMEVPRKGDLIDEVEGAVVDLIKAGLGNKYNLRMIVAVGAISGHFQFFKLLEEQTGRKEDMKRIKAKAIKNSIKWLFSISLKTRILFWKKRELMRLTAESFYEALKEIYFNPKVSSSAKDKF